MAMASTSVPTGACSWHAPESFEEGARRVRSAMVDARHSAETAASDARLAVRRYPLASVAAGAAAGALFGAACGFFVTLLAKRHR